MDIYIDLIFILNFLFDLLLLFSLAVLLRRQTNLKRLLTSSLFGTLSLLIFFFTSSPILNIFFKIIISIMMVIICFGFKNIVYTIRNIFYLYTISIFLGGFLYLVNTSFAYKTKGLLVYNTGLKINFLVLLIISPIVIYIYIKELKQIKNNYANYYNVDIYLPKNKITSLTAFLDTGNNLYDPYKKRPIILVDKTKIDFDFNEEKTILVPYSTLNNHGLLKCIIPNKIYIDNVGVRTNFLIGLSEDKINIDGVDCILHKKLL